jgi:hypothetical protein
MLVEDIIFEANVEPKSLEIIDKTLKKWRDAATEANPGINHDPFFKKLRRDIINDGADEGITAHTTMYGGEHNFAMLQPYKPQEDDPDYIKNATDVYQLNVDTKDQYSLQGKPALGVLGGYIEELFGPGMPFNKFSKAVTDPDTPPEIKNKVIPLQKKYEQGKFNLQNLQIKMEEFVKMTRDWRYDPRERQRVEAEAPIIMKFKNGYMWVRLDSKYEMEREGEMMQNCISGYCPVGDLVDLTFGLRDKFNQEVELEDQTDDEAYEWLADWFAENDTDVQDFLSNKQEEEDLQGEADDAVDEVLGMDEDEAFDWMHSQLIDADADIETGELFTGHLIYSLRDKNGESHVSAEYDPNMDMDYVEPESALGKQNKEALDKYKPYIKALNNFFEEHPETFGPKGNTKDMPFHPDYDDGREHDEPTESTELKRIKHLAGI